MSWLTASQDPTNEQHEDANQVHLTASENPNYSPKTIAEASKASNRKSFARKEYGVFGRDTTLPSPSERRSHLPESGKGTSRIDGERPIKDIADRCRSVLRSEWF